MSHMPPSPPPPMSGYAPQVPRGTSGMAIASLVCGIVSLLLFCFWPLSVPLGIVALILGLIARSKIKRGEATGGGLALTGIVTGAIGMLISIGVVVGIIANKDKIEQFQQNQIQKLEQMEQQQKPQTGSPTTLP